MDREMNITSEKRKSAQDKQHIDLNHRDASKRASQTAFIVAMISAGASLAGLGFNYYATERVRTEIQAQTLALNRQAAELDRVKVGIEAAAQRTAELNAATASSKLKLDTRVADTTQGNETTKIAYTARQDHRDETKLAPDITKIIHDLRPALTITCGGTREAPDLLKLSCTFNSQAALAVTVTPKSITVLDHVTHQPVADWSTSIDGMDTNTVLPGEKGNNDYYAKLTTVGQQLVRPIFVFKFAAVSDEASVNTLRKVARGDLAEKDIQKWSHQDYSWSVQADAGQRAE
jgi:hypothetical protein